MYSTRPLLAVGAATAVLLALFLGPPSAHAFRFGSSGGGLTLPARGRLQSQQSQQSGPMGRATMVMMSATPGSDGKEEGGKPRQPQRSERHSRRAALQLAGGLVLGPLAMALGAGSAVAATTPGAAAAADGAATGVAGASAHKSMKELQFELMKIGLDYTHAYKFDEAEAVYSELIELFGSPLTLSDRDKALLAKAYSNRGNARFNLNRLSGAVVDYSRAIELSPETFEYWTNRGLVFESMAEELLAAGDTDKAGQLFEAAMENYDHGIVLDPENHRVYANAGDVLTHLGRTDSALEYYRQALVLYPVSPALSGKVALLEVENGNLERGTFLLDTLVHRHPEFSEMVLAAGAIDWTLGRFTDGIDKYSAAVERDPRLLDDRYLERERHWPPTMMKMVGKLRQAGATDGLRSTAVSWFESRGQLI